MQQNCSSKSPKFAKKVSRDHKNPAGDRKVCSEVLCCKVSKISAAVSWGSVKGTEPMPVAARPGRANIVISRIFCLKRSMFPGPCQYRPRLALAGGTGFVLSHSTWVAQASSLCSPPVKCRCHQGFFGTTTEQHKTSEQTFRSPSGFLWSRLTFFANFGLFNEQFCCIW